jgi:membrane-associated progesterone receptor component
MGLGRFVARLFGKKEKQWAPLPEAEERDYSLQELAAYDGSDPGKPLLIGIRGQVYDVTRGRDFYGPGGPYGMFAGKDCTRALAKVSFDAELFTGDVDGLEPDELALRR